MRTPCRLPISRLVLLMLLFGLPAGLALSCSAAEMPPPPAHKLPKRATRATIEAIEEQWRQAQLTGDVAAMDRLLADDYLGIGAAGQVNTKALQLERMRNRSATFTQLDVSDSKIKIAGKIAIVTSRVEFRATTDGTPLAGTLRSTRIYQQNAAGVWKMISSEATHVTPANGGTKRPGDDAPAP